MSQDHNRLDDMRRAKVETYKMLRGGSGEPIS
jgi:hypothetical protein